MPEKRRLPIHGQSLASEVFLDSIKKDHKVTIVNTAKQKGGGSLGSVKRVFKVGGVFLGAARGIREADAVYLTISELVFGNMKDLFTYLLCFWKLDKAFIHLHGGAGMIRIMQGNHSLLARFNAFFMRRLKGVIILGETHRRIFAGTFHSKAHEEIFLSRIRPYGNIRYHGVVRGEKKKTLFGLAHVFCLPTYYPYEGQPISILEAYASGCVVITTDHSGIKDIFADGVNGYEVATRSPDSIRDAILRILSRPSELMPLALLNRETAEGKYRTTIFNCALRRIVEA